MGKAKTTMGTPPTGELESNQAPEKPKAKRNVRTTQEQIDSLEKQIRDLEASKPEVMKKIDKKIK